MWNMWFIQPGFAFLPPKQLRPQVGSCTATITSGVKR